MTDRLHWYAAYLSKVTVVIRATLAYFLARAFAGPMAALVAQWSLTRRFSESSGRDLHAVARVQAISCFSSIEEVEV